MIDGLVQDVKYALRSLRRSPGFAAAAVVTLGLGIGANTAIFSLMNAVRFRTLPLTAPEELYFVALGSGSDLMTVSNPLWLDRVKERNDVFSDVTAYNIRDFKVRSSREGVENVVGQYVSGNFHLVTGAAIARGRGFTAEDDRAPGGGSLAVISDGYWRRRFGADPDIVGKTLIVGGRTIAIVGVTAPGFVGMQPGRSVDITLPLSIRVADEPDFLTSEDSWTNMPIVVRLKPGTDIRQAQAVVQDLFRDHVAQHRIGRFSRMPNGEARSALLLTAARGHDRLRNEYSTPLFALMGMVGLVLLICCVNVANLLLVRGAARAGEVAVRMSVGANRWRLIRQFLTESTVFAVCGGLIGSLLAGWVTLFIARFFQESQNPIVIDVQPDATVFAFATMLSLLTAMAFGVVPAIGATGIDLTPALKPRSRRPAAGSWWTGRQSLVVVQIALCLVLVFGAGLLVRTLRNLQHVNGGFVTENILVAALDANDTTFPLERMVPLCNDLIERLSARAGAVSASCSTMSPVNSAFEIRALGLPAPPPGPAGDSVYANTVTPDYFRTFGIELVRGRLFTPQDTNAAPRVAVVNEALARAFFGGADPIGRPIAFGSNPDLSRALTVVGVVRDARQTLRDPSPRMVYQPLAQIRSAPDLLSAAIRTTGDPSPLAGLLRGELRALSGDVAVTWVRTMEQQIAASLTRERILATLSTGFGLLALLLACIGLYGVLSYDVARRTRDIGIRMALGAERSMILRSVLRQTAAITVAGLVIGLTAAWLLSQFVERFLFGLTPRDPLTLVVAAVMLAGSTLLAGYLPARRASHIEPTVALRME
jgi:predicted permease